MFCASSLFYLQIGIFCPDGTAHLPAVKLHLFGRHSHEPTGKCGSKLFKQYDHWKSHTVMWRRRMQKRRKLLRTFTYASGSLLSVGNRSSLMRTRHNHSLKAEQASYRPLSPIQVLDRARFRRRHTTALAARPAFGRTTPHATL